MSESLRDKATSGVVWSAIERFGQQACGIVVQIVLARILAPEQFGLIAIVVTFITLSSILVDAGFGRALIQRKEVGDRELSTIFYFNISISCGMAALLYATAPAVAVFYALEELEILLQVLSLKVIIGAFGSIQTVILTRELRFRRVFRATLPSFVLSGGLGIYLALHEYGVWALVAQSLSQSLIMSLGMWLQSNWRPKFIFDLQCLREMFPYGSRLALSTFLDRGFRNLYVLVIGKVFSVTDLAYFERARSLQKIPVENIHGILGRVTFPLFSKLQDDLPRMKRGMRKALQLSTLLVIPGLALMSAVAEPLIVTLIGEKWLPAVPYLKWLCLIGMLFPIHAMNINALLALGRSDLMLRLEIFKKSLVIVNILVTYRWGITAMIYGMVIVSFINLVVNTHYTQKFLDYSCLSQLRDLLPIILLAWVVFAADALLIDVLPLGSFSMLLATVGAGGVIMLCGVRFVGSGLKDELRAIVSRLPGSRVLIRLLV